MNPIDQIRKALEADDTSDIGINEIAALLASHDAYRSSMQEWAEKYEASQKNAAVLLQRAKAAEVRAAEMQERCARVCDARVMGDNNREDAEAKACAAAIRAIKE